MRSRYRHLDNHTHFVTSTIVEWIPVFTDEKYFQILIDAVNYYQKEKELKIYAYVILDNHFHFILSCDNLSNIMRSFKRFTATNIIKQLRNDNRTDILEKFRMNKKQYKTKSTYQIWQEGFHPKLINSQEMLVQKIDYIHYNPVKKGLVKEITDWKYSSARYYYLDEEGLIEIENAEG